ncbi:MAG: hypothetical protein HC842_09320 [Cytophagales bacterium]|nr:hypothetical protein [Cytophagales bacterium]
MFLGELGDNLIVFFVAVALSDYLKTSLLPTGESFLSVLACLAGLLLVPVGDLGRVFVVRLARKQSPFAADKGHVHHLLIARGLAHWQATSLLVAFNLLVYFLLSSL